MKRLLSLLLALACVLSITACTEPDAKSSDEKADTQAQSADSESDTAEPAEITEDDVRAVGEGFMSAICAFDTKEMAKYADDPKKIPASLDISVLKKSMTIPDGMEAYEEEFGELFDYMLEKILESCTYEIESIATKGVKYQIVARWTYFDSSAPENDISALLSKLNDESYKKQLINDLMSAGKITEASTEKQIMDAVVPVVIKDIKDSLGSVKLKTKTSKILIILTTASGAPLVDMEASGF